MKNDEHKTEEKGDSHLSQTLAEAIREQFPIKRIIDCYAYGSMIIPQKDNKGKMIDLIFIVDDVKKFHEENMIRNWKHYSLMSRLSGLTTWVNQKGTRVYFNQGILLGHDLFIKYGVISKNDFIINLTKWNNFFIAGRFHKPVMKVPLQEIFIDKETHRTDIERAIDENREFAFSLIALSVPQFKFIPLQDFYSDIAKISYIGDIRTYLLAEKKEKVQNLVLGALNNYHKIYKEIAFRYPKEVVIKENLIQITGIEEFYKKIPPGLKKKLWKSSDLTATVLFDRNYIERKRLIEKKLKGVNLRYSIYAILSGMFSSDYRKSVCILRYNSFNFVSSLMFWRNIKRCWDDLNALLQHSQYVKN